MQARFKLAHAAIDAATLTGSVAPKPPNTAVKLAAAMREYSNKNSEEGTIGSTQNDITNLSCCQAELHGSRSSAICIAKKKHTHVNNFIKNHTTV